MKGLGPSHGNGAEHSSRDLQCLHFKLRGYLRLLFPLLRLVSLDFPPPISRGIVRDAMMVLKSNLAALAEHNDPLAFRYAGAEPWTALNVPNKGFGL